MEMEPPQDAGMKPEKLAIFHFNDVYEIEGFETIKQKEANAK